NRRRSSRMSRGAPGGAGRAGEAGAPGGAGEACDGRQVAPALDAAVRGYLDHLAVERGVARNTLLSYRRDLRRYVRYLTARGITDLDGVGESDVLAFVG